MGIKPITPQILRRKGKFVCQVCALLLLILLVACQGLEPREIVETPQVTSTSTPGVDYPPLPQPTSTSIQTASRPTTLVIWVPPQFGPQDTNPAGALLKARLEEFSQRRSGVKIETRLKAEEGPGGLLDSLTTASAAAPNALPDLVALPYGLLETAALKGLLRPIDDLTTAADDPGWYDYARQLAKLQSSTFGLPFAGDALSLVYRSTASPPPATDWSAFLQGNTPLVFPAADPQALFILAMYQAAGGAIRDEQGRPYLSLEPLESTFTFFKEAEAAGLMSSSNTQYQSDNQIWEAYIDGSADLVVTWTSRFLNGKFGDSEAVRLPTPDGDPYTLASGWVWAIATPHPEQLELCVQLAEFLTESSFLGQWSEAAGMLPPRPEDLTSWRNGSLRSLMGQIALSAQLLPSSDIITSLGPILEKGAVQVLKKQSEPLAAAQEAMDAIATP